VGGAVSEGRENIVALAKELHVSRRQLYWRDERDPEIPGMEAPRKTRAPRHFANR
jgi:hypothetical protein